MTEAELRHCLGEKIMSRYYPDRLYNYDAEDEENNVTIGETEEGEEVTIRPPRRRGRPARLRERQLHPHGRRPQVRPHGPLPVLLDPLPPHPRYALAHPLADGPAQLGDARLHKQDGQTARRASQGLPHRDDPQQRRLPRLRRLYGETRSGMGPANEGELPRHPQRDAEGTAAALAEDLPHHQGPAQDDGRAAPGRPTPYTPRR